MMVQGHRDRSRRHRTGARSVGFKVKVLYMQYSSPDHPRGAGKPREGVTEWKTAQGNHFLCCMRFELRGRGLGLSLGPRLCSPIEADLG